MRPPAKIEPWLSPKLFAVWVREAPTREAYQKRLAIWLTSKGKNATEVATTLHVSKQAVWLWVGQFNKQGPKGLDRKGRGGRRWAYLTIEEEKALLIPFFKMVEKGKRVTAPMLFPEVCKASGKKISMGYVYRIMHRHGLKAKSGDGPNKSKVSGKDTTADLPALEDA